VKALIKVGYGCNDHCSFCHTLDVRHVDGSSEEVHRKIERARELGHTMVVLSGGEPTIRPELVQWAKHVADLGMGFGLVTNGRMLSYPRVVEQLLRHRLEYVYLSLHGGSAKVHDLMVRSEAFEQTYGALANLTGRGIDLTANCVITRHNVDHLKGLVDACLEYPDLVVKLSMVEAKGGGDALFEHLMPRVAHVARRVREAIDYGRAKVAERGGGPRFVHGAIPLCLMQGYEDAFDDLKTHGFWTMTEVGEPDYFPVDDLNKVQPPESCAGCALSGPCPGLYRGYYDVFGADELSAVRGRPRSNSFNYVYEGLVRESHGGTVCPLLDGLGVTPWDRGRHLFVENDGRVARFRARTRDFSDAEVTAVKLDAGQIYVDVTRGKDAPNDFARDLVKLTRSPLCTDCPERPRCTGLWAPARERVFARDDARVRELLGELAGRVLDVGCGEGPYEDVLEPLARAETIRYVGLDPDEARIHALRERWPWAELEVGRAEDLDGEHRAGFDHVLVLRSWNHLADPRAAVARIIACIAPGGTLTIVDNVAFGLVRTRAQTERAEASVAALEHYRNDDGAAAHALVAEHGLTLLERRDVGPETSNQWLLRYRR
jgi:MoaA/NifB/PqqE/SkfB family radical SAM enzyme/SAM-dependent methyltransferase